MLAAAVLGCATAAAAAPSYNITQTFNRVPNRVFPDACNSTFAWNEVDGWYLGKAKLTVTILDFKCMGAMRQLHWHPDADEWGYVIRGRFSVAVPAPDQDPWPAAYNRAPNGSVWFFPKGWWHAITCETDDCLLVLMFNDIQEYAHPAEIDVLDLVHLMTTARDDVAAATLSVSVDDYVSKMKPRFSGRFLNERFQITPPVPGACANGVCPFPDGSQETTYLSPVSSFANGNRRDLGGGVVLYDVKEKQLPLIGHPGAGGARMSGQLMELAAGAIRPLVWITNANAIVFCIEGTAELTVYGGVTDETKKEVFTAILTPHDVGYIPHNAAYTFREVTGKNSAKLTLGFDIGSWRDMEAKSTLNTLPRWMIDSSLNLTLNE